MHDIALQQFGPKRKNRTGRASLHEGEQVLTIITIDFEASCLPRHGRSYPIEVGIAGMRAGTITSRSWLIRPHHDWQGWDWTPRAQALHGLSRERIARDGVDAAQVLVELQAAVQGHRLVADSLIDQYWLDTLAAAAGQESALTIDHVSIVMEELRVGESRIARALDHANAMVQTRHRAAEDARWLAAVIADLGGDMAPLTRSISHLALHN